MPAVLSPGDIQGFESDGYVYLRGAFGAENARAMRDEWWAELAEVHGVLRDDRATWRQPPADLKRAKASPLQHAIATERVRGAVEDLVGQGAWAAPSHWGRVLTTFPAPGEWRLPTEVWHWDNPASRAGLFVVSLIGEVAPRGGGTLIVAGSHHLVQRHEARLAARPGRPGHAASRDLFLRSDPWLMALSGKAPSPRDRIAAFMSEGAEIDGVPVRVVELTGEPGDMVLCHPAIVHGAAPNAADQPRFTRILQHLRPAQSSP